MISAVCSFYCTLHNGGISIIEYITIWSDYSSCW